jgi:hypothetical protein
MDILTTKLLTETRNLAMMETLLITTVAHLSARLNVVMDLSLDLRNVIWELPMLMPPTNVRPTAKPPNVVMDMLTSMRNATMLPQELEPPNAEPTANCLTVETELLTQSMENNVMLDLPETLISHQLDAQQDVPSILAHMSEQLELETSTEPWPAPDASIPTLDLPLDHHAQDPFNGWLPNLFKRFLNSKLIPSNTSSELELRDPKREIVNSLILTVPEHVTVSRPWDPLTLLLVLPVKPFPVNPLLPPLLTSSVLPTPPELQSSNKLSELWSHSLSVNHSSSPHTLEVEPTLLTLLPVKLKPSTTEDSLILLTQSTF